MLQDLKLSSQQKILINFLTFIMLIVGLAYFIILPSIKTIYEMGNMINEQRQDLEEKYKKGQSIKQLNKQLATAEPKVDLLDTAMLDHGTEFDFITNLENLAETNNVDIKINLGEGKTNEKFNYYITPLTITANGKFSNITSFLKKIENLDFYINIDTLNLSRNEQIASQETGDYSKSDISLTLNAKTFWK